MRAHRQLRSVQHLIALLALTFLIPLPALATPTTWLSPNQRDHALAGVIVNARGEPVPESELLSELATSRFAFLGEKHDNADHHRIEARLIARRLASQPGTAVVFEMLDDAQRPLIPGLTAEDSLETIKAKLAWPAKGWDFAVYGPLFKASLDGGILVAGNIGKKFIGELYEKGEPMLQGDARFLTVFSASPETRAYLLDTIFEAHCGMRPRDTLAPMVSIQLAKDASMASAMADQKAALLIAGGEHVRTRTGVPSHLLKLKPGERRVVIQLMEVVAGETDPKVYVERAGPADFYWLTPGAVEKDNCADVKGRAAR
ncbi:MAG: ChaN family lipoprotein [Arenimonas sp.]|nr:ChaN family lipoprotein [Arenimonas sp.]